MNKTATKTAARNRRHSRIRSRISGTATRPRLAVFRSNKFVYAQLIDDENNHTLAAADSRQQKDGTTMERADAVGKAIAAAAKKNKISKVVFDRGGFTYQGIVAAVADGARAGGLEL